jgi:hypothetical protein
MYRPIRLTCGFYRARVIDPISHHASPAIRQPFAPDDLAGDEDGGWLELSWHSRPTRIIGERFWIYASQSSGSGGQGSGRKAWSLELAMAGGEDAVPPWMPELERGLILRGPDDGELPMGVIVGSAVIERAGEPATGT